MVLVLVGDYRFGVVLSFCPEVNFYVTSGADLIATSVKSGLVVDLESWWSVFNGVFGWFCWVFAARRQYGVEG